MNWSTPTDFDSVCRRAAGRRRYNAERQAEARERFKIVIAAILPPEGRKRGTQAQLARTLGVHPATISRDVKKWKRTLLEVMERLRVLHQSEESEEVSDNLKIKLDIEPDEDIIPVPQNHRRDSSRVAEL